MGKMSRRDFLKGAAIFGGGTVFLPGIFNNVSSSSAYHKINEFVVPAGHIAPGFVFHQFPQYRKYIVEITAKLTKGVIWAIDLRVNAESGVEYWQFAHMQYAAFSDGFTYEPPEPKVLITDRLEFPVSSTQNVTLDPYTAKVEITNVPGMHKSIMTSGNYLLSSTSPVALFEFTQNAICRDDQPVENIAIGANFPTGYFNSSTIVALYGVE